ncbi:MAG TPA: ABC transporter ATP-binding protein [Candidatus Acidoferrum sp.]|nr:ABC transporter ATP-binding protein [Candidatus Acidoferrum sp.]
MTDPALSLDQLAKRFDRTEVLQGISASVGPGEVIGLLGLNGAGKTTLLETALGFSLPDGGSARIFGQASIEMDGATKARIGFVPQRDELLEGMKAESYLALIAEFYPNWNRQLVDRLAREWAVPLATRINKLSVGQRQKLSIISALGHEPDLIILDEPVASLDPVARRQFLKELVDIASGQTRSIVFSTHIVSDLERVASRVWLMQEGRLALDAGMDDLKENIVRLSLPKGAQLPPAVAGKSVLRKRSAANGETTVLLRDWNHYAAADLPAGTQIDSLSLEDLFLELHA